MPDVIFKHKLDHRQPTVLSLPRDHQVVLVGPQGGHPHAWIRQPAKPAGKTVTCTLTVVSTGDTFDSAAVHVGSYRDGRNARHVLQT